MVTAGVKSRTFALYLRAFSSRTTQSSTLRAPDGDKSGEKSIGGNTDSDSADSIFVILPCQGQNTSLSCDAHQDREEKRGTERRLETHVLSARSSHRQSATEQVFTAMGVSGRFRLRCSACKVVALCLRPTHLEVA